MPPVGIKNNNYLNVKNGRDPWMDADGRRAASDARGHAVFRDPAYGVRAGLLLLRTYFLKHSLHTVREILSRWAPSSDTVGSRPGGPPNDPDAYAAFVARRIGTTADQRLELFRDDGSVDHLGQLEGLFLAMAAYEVGGGFEVPAAVFRSGIELVEPGIGRRGTAPAAGDGAAAAPTRGWRIGGAVGREDRGAVNAKADVEMVQSMLRHAAMILGDPLLDPGRIDGVIGATPSRSPTVAAITRFQKRFLPRPDGVVAVDGRTWQELVAVMRGPAERHSSSPGEEYFPLAAVPAADWTTGARKFAAARSGNRAHAACDLYAPAGTTIFAIADGTVVRGPVEFYAGTYVLEVDHGAFLARYGEIQKSAWVRTGDRVTAGQPIARVGHLSGISVASDMLHLELYDKTASGPLTVSEAESAIAPGGRPFLRRRDLLDPTPFLRRWQEHLPSETAAHAPMFDGDGTGIPTRGFCLHIRRVREEKREGFEYARTVGDYQCYWNGAPLHDLDGQMVEREGPGDNTAAGVAAHRRIAAGRYRLAIHRGQKYRTYGYAPEGPPLPGLLLLDTAGRSAILVHPTHHAHGYLSSIGCLNPAVGLRDADSRVHLPDSRARVIAMIEALKAKLGARFPQSGPIPGALVVIEGEPSLS